jgi:hypothetical protein
MKAKRTILTALAISATVGFSLDPGWSQSTGSGATGTNSGTAGKTRKAPSDSGTGSSVGGESSGSKTGQKGKAGKSSDTDRQRFRIRRPNPFT